MDLIDILSVIMLIASVWHWANTQSRRQRMALLAEQLQPYQIEKGMQQLTEAYMRALGEKDPQRQTQIWQIQEPIEQQLNQEFQALAASFAKVPVEKARTLKLALPGIDKWLPQSTFDTRQVLKIHAEGIERAVLNAAGREPKDKAFLMMAEMFLMQHSCHWFCRSKTIASARMFKQHQTPYEHTLQSVSPETRRAYLALVKGPALGH